jgi:hypothetical protein
MAPVSAMGAPERMLQRKIGRQNSIARRKFQRAEITG